MTIFNSVNFNIFYNKIKSQKMNIKLAYQLSSLHKQIQPDYEFYQEQLQSILLKYGELDESGNLIPTEDGTSVKIRPGSYNDCLREIDELQNTESTITITPLSIQALENLEATPEELDSISNFIE